jgi:hypothetical protein
MEQDLHGKMVYIARIPSSLESLNRALITQTKSLTSASLMMAYAQVEAIFPWVPLVILYIGFKLVRWTRILFSQRKTLSSIPGPRWAAWTRFWLVKTLASGESAAKFVEVNKLYGEHESDARILGSKK